MSKQAASTLPQVQQIQDNQGNPVVPAPLPTDVMFPLIPAFQKQEQADEVGETVKQAAAVQCDRPHVEPDDQMAMIGRAATKAIVADAMRQMGVQAAAAPSVVTPNPIAGMNLDAAAGGPSLNGVPTNAMEKAVDDVPDTEPGQGGTFAPLIDKKSGRKVAAVGTPDFRKGYGFAANWKPGEKLVATGSSEFEAGLFVGMSKNTPEAQVAWVQENESRGEVFAKRIAVARAYAQHVASKQPNEEHVGIPSKVAEMTTLAPTDLPLGGATALEGAPPTPAPLLGGADPSAPGGAAPYNGAAPLGASVTPGQGYAPLDAFKAKIAAAKGQS